jgi:cysteine desulfurase NifS/selenium donor protein
MEIIYLDYNATTPVDPEVVAAMKPALESVFGNPSSQHAYGMEARKIVETARAQVAGLLGCNKEEIIFTSGGTESNNHAIKGAVLANRNRGRHVITSQIEHPATLEVCRFLQREGFEITFLPVDSAGRISIAEIEAAIRKDTILISIMHANNEIGTIQPIEEISRLAKSHKIILHTDAAQSAGKIPCNVKKLGIDLLSFTGHKFYGPKGIGGLFIREGTGIEKIIHGADHEANRRAGTENVPEIAGFGKAAEQASENLISNQETMQRMRDLLWKQLSDSLPGIRRNGSSDHCLPNTLSVSFPGIDANTILSAAEGVAASAGAACHAATENISHVLKAIGLSASDAQGTIRFSTGKSTTHEEILKAASIISKTVLPMMEGNAPGPGTGGKQVKLTQFTHGMGCACKMRPQDLEKVLSKIPLPDDPEILVDIRDSDDATVWKVDENTAWVQSVDFFTPVVDDPFTFGAITAANSLSDIYAMGARPVFGLNIVAFPVKRLSLEILDEILDGAQSVARQAGIHMLGGHTIEDNELKFGMVVNGIVHPSRIVRNSGAKPGDVLILTKAIGTGILSTALKKGALGEDEYQELADSMSSLNKTASEAMMAYPVNACTDVTGFGLLGHLLEMLRASDVEAEIVSSQVPMLRGVKKHLAAGIFPGGSKQNLDYTDPYTKWANHIDRDLKLCLADAQTSGGLLISIPEEEARKLLIDIRKAGCPKAEIIGSILPGSEIAIHIR